MATSRGKVKGKDELVLKLGSFFVVGISLLNIAILNCFKLAVCCFESMFEMGTGVINPFS